MTVNFKDTYIGSANLHAGQSVRVEVTGVITDDTEYKNEAETNNSHDKPNVPGYSGSIRINKTDDSKENPKVLKGATFQIKKQGENAPIQFVKTNTGVYTSAVWQKHSLRRLSRRFPAVRRTHWQSGR